MPQHTDAPTALKVALLGGGTTPLRAALDADRYDAVVCEAAFLGALPLLSVPAARRLPGAAS